MRGTLLSSSEFPYMDLSIRAIPSSELFDSEILFVWLAIGKL
jgi:hypothetical protein